MPKSKNAENCGCSDIDECAEGNHNCGYYSTCQNEIDNGFSCICDSGYEMSTSGECVDIDECLNSPCDTNGICENSLGTFTCKCADGYDGDGYTCNDINECDKSDTCDVRATCVNHDGTFSCQCDSGFQSGFIFLKIKKRLFRIRDVFIVKFL